MKYELVFKTMVYYTITVESDSLEEAEVEALETLAENPDYYEDSRDDAWLDSYSELDDQI